MQSYPYEPEERGSDYVRLASIAAGDAASHFLSSCFQEGEPAAPLRTGERANPDVAAATGRSLVL